MRPSNTLKDSLITTTKWKKLHFRKALTTLLKHGKFVHPTLPQILPTKQKPLLGQSRFQVPYSICGCPLPKDSAKSRLAKKLGLSAPEQTGPNHLIGCPENDDEAEASHASEHPSVYIFDHPSSSTGRAERQRINKLRLERDAREAETGSFSPLIRRRQVNHDPAFLYPVPLYNSYGMMGYPGVGACAVVSGGTMNCDGLGANGGGTSSRSGMGGCVVGYILLLHIFDISFADITCLVCRAGACGGAVR